MPSSLTRTLQVITSRALVSVHYHLVLLPLYNDHFTSGEFIPPFRAATVTESLVQ
jgi:hypothetical protein